MATKKADAFGTYLKTIQRLERRGPRPRTSEVGTVIEVVGPKRRRVEFQRSFPLKTRGRPVRRRVVGIALDGSDESRVGDVVEVMASRLSRLHRWRIVRILEERPRQVLADEGDPDE